MWSWTLVFLNLDEHKLLLCIETSKRDSCCGVCSILTQIWDAKLILYLNKRNTSQLVASYFPFVHKTDFFSCANDGPAATFDKLIT